jgi:hypothetical protein
VAVAGTVAVADAVFNGSRVRVVAADSVVVVVVVGLATSAITVVSEREAVVNG